MKVSMFGKLVGFVLTALMMMLSMSFDAMGQGRSRRVTRLDDKKCAKFVNCHDARDGRWDGRGPDRNLGITDRIFGRNRRGRDRDAYRIIRNRRNRDRDRDTDRIIRNRRHRDRDFDLFPF